MNNDQKLLLTSGVILAVLGSFYISLASVPQSLTQAVFFPLSILAVIFGVAFLLWGAGWMALEKVNVLK